MKYKPRIFSICWIIFISFTVMVYIIRSHLSGFYYGETDFFKFYQAVRFYFAGQNLYSSTVMQILTKTTYSWGTANGNLNPPFLTLLLLPFYYFNYATALKIWTISSIIMMFLGTWLALQPFKSWHKYTLPVFAGFIVYTPNSANLSYGQVTAYLLVLLAGAWLAGRKKWDILAGVLIGIACAIKIFCGLFLIYFLCIRRFKLLFTAIFTGCFAFLISLALFGIDNYMRYRTVLKKVGWYSASWNASFYGFFMRLFSHTESNHPSINIPYLAEVLTVICCGWLLIYLIHLWQKMKESHFDLGFSVTIIAMLLISPLGWTYYFGLLLISYLVFIQQSHDTRYRLIFPLCGCMILCFSTLFGELLGTSSIKTFSQIIFKSGMPFYALIIFLVCYLLLITEKLRRDTQHNVFTLPRTAYTITERNWLIIYIITFLPSLISLAYFTRNLFIFKAS